MDKPIFNRIINNAAFIKAALLFVPLLILASCSQESKYQQLVLGGPTMGTTWSIKVVLQEGESIDQEALQRNIEERLKSFNQIVSTYIASSEISQFNNAPAATPYKVDAELISLIQQSQQIHQRSQGLFDITVAPLIDLWGFGKVHFQVDRLPSETEIKTAKQRVGFDKISLDAQNSTLQKQRSGIQINLSAIAKGRGVDILAEIMQQQKQQNYMVEIGGEIRAQGINSTGKAWQIAIEEPLASQRSIQRVVSLQNTAIATSGDYRNFFEIAGQRYSHSINPNTGWPVKHELVSVTVLHSQAMIADAWATALLIAGPERAMQMAEENQLAVLLIEKNENGFTEQINTLFAAKIKAAQ